MADIVSREAQSLFALRTLEAHGLTVVVLYCVCTAILVSRLTYALLAWLGFASESDLHWIQSVLGRAARWGLTGNRSLPSVADLAALCKTLPICSV